LIPETAKRRIGETEIVSRAQRALECGGLTPLLKNTVHKEIEMANG
jgi:hypothetical protein